MAVEPRFVIVSGPAAAGKTTLSVALGERLNLPVLSKDGIKAALRSCLDPTMAPAALLGHAAVSVLLAVATKMNTGAVLDSVWRGHHATGLEGLPGRQIEVFCRCDMSVLEKRYATRVRPAGYVPEHGSRDDLWSAETLTPIGGRPLIEVDTAHSVDIAALSRQVDALLSGSPEGQP